MKKYKKEMDVKYKFVFITASNKEMVAVTYMWYNIDEDNLFPI